jgi:hypothetical protein
MCLNLMWVWQAMLFQRISLGLVFNILPSLGHLKTFSGNEPPLHFSITLPRAYPGFQSLHDVSIYYLLKALESRVHRAITRCNNLGGGCMFIYMCSARWIRFILKSIAFMVCEHEYMNMHPPQIIASCYGLDSA